MAGESGYWQRYWSKRLTRRGLLRGTALGAAGLAAAAVVGCGGGEEGPTATTPAATGPAASTPAATATPAAEARAYWGEYPPPPKYSTLAPQQLLADYHFSVMGPKVQVLGTPRMGGVFVPQTYNPPPTLHPLDPSVSTTGQWPQGPIVSNLVMPDWWDEPEINGPTTRYAVSESFETPDPQTFLFKLRTPRPWFHDVPPANGEALTIEDIRATYELYAGHRFFKKNFEMIKSIDEPEPGVCRITTTEPSVHLLGALRKEAFCILNAKAIAEGDEALNNKAIGLGPFTQGKFVPNTIRLYKRNRNWWWPKDQFGNQLPYMDGFVMNIISDPAAGKAAFRTKQTDYYRPTSLEEFESLLGEMKEQVWPHVSIGPASSTNALHLSMRTPLLQDVQVRRALSLAVDKQFILDTLLGGGGSPRPWIPWYFRGRRWPETLQEMGEWYKFDPEGARNLLAAAGVQTPLKLEMYFSGSTTQAGGGAAALALGDPYVEPVRLKLKDVGIEMDLKALDYRGLTRTMFDGQWTGMASASIGTSAVDADEWVQRAVSTSGSNSAGINDPKVDELFLKERAEVDPEERAAIFQEIEKYVVQDQLLIGAPVFPRAFSMHLRRRYVHNLIESSLYTINGGLQTQEAESWLDENVPSRNIDSF